MGDTQITDWTIANLQQPSTDDPFFMAVGYYRPHMPLYAPKRYFDLYDGMNITLPTTMENDRDDLSPTAIHWALQVFTRRPQPCSCAMVEDKCSCELVYVWGVWCVCVGAVAFTVVERK